jgi:hypothetical protein
MSSRPSRICNSHLAITTLLTIACHAGTSVDRPASACGEARRGAAAQIRFMLDVFRPATARSSDLEIVPDDGQGDVAIHLLHDLSAIQVGDNDAHDAEAKDQEAWLASAQPVLAASARALADSNDATAAVSATREQLARFDAIQTEYARRRGELHEAMIALGARIDAALADASVSGERHVALTSIRNTLDDTRKLQELEHAHEHFDPVRAALTQVEADCPPH